MSSFINQTNLSKENPNNHHPNMIMKQKSTLKGKKSGGLKKNTFIRLIYDWDSS